MARKKSFPPTKTIDKKLFYLHKVFPSKDRAKKEAKRVRGLGFDARVIGSAVYTKFKAIRRRIKQNGRKLTLIKTNPFGKNNNFNWKIEKNKPEKEV